MTSTRENKETMDEVHPLSKAQLLETFDRAHEQLITAAVAAEKPGGARKPGKWGPREVLAHIAGWAAQARAHIPQVLAGSPPVSYTDASQHAAVDDAFNAAVIVMIGNQSFEQIKDLSGQAHQHLKQVLQEQDESLFVPSSYVYERLKLIITHHLHHAQELHDRY